MFCPKCGTPLPDDAQFCFKCGRSMTGLAGRGGPGGAGPVPPPPPPPQETGPPKPLKCQACGAPLTPQPGEMVVACEYCGSTVSMGQSGWKAIQNHSMLIPKMATEDEALAACRGWLDQGLLRRHFYEESKLLEGKLSVVPFWVIPCAAVTHYTYNDVAVQAATVGGSIAAAALLGGMMGGRNNGMMLPAGMMVGMGMGGGMGGQASKRAAELANQYEYPIIAVQGLQKYQPHDYKFDLSERQLFDKRKLPAGAPILNGDIGEESAQYSARNYVTQVQAEKAHAQHRMVESLKTEVNCSDGELLHVPVWYFTFQHGKDQKILLVDAHKMAVMNAVE